MTIRIPQAQLESYLWGASVLLLGYIDAGDYKQFIFPLLFYKRLCDVFDEEVAAALAESGERLRQLAVVEPQKLLQHQAGEQLRLREFLGAEAVRILLHPQLAD